MSDVIRWENPEEQAERLSILDELRERPGEWALIAEKVTASSLRNTVAGGALNTIIKDPSFEDKHVVSPDRKSMNVYVRYNPVTIASGAGLKTGQTWMQKPLTEGELRKVQQETLVALFDGDTQVTDWAPFAEGKAPVFDNWLDPRREHEQYHAMNQMTMRTQDGNKVRASTSVQEKVTKSYAITWRTTW